MARYHYVLTVQYIDRDGAPNVRSLDGHAGFNDGEDERRRFDYLMGVICRHYGIPGMPATTFYRCVLDEQVS